MVGVTKVRNQGKSWRPVVGAITNMTDEEKATLTEWCISHPKFSFQQLKDQVREILKARPQRNNRGYDWIEIDGVRIG